MPDLSPEDFALISNLPQLLATRFPRGMHLNQSGVITEAGVARKITSLTDLSASARAPRQFQVELRGEMIEFEVRGLMECESAEADKIDAGIVPPQKFVNERGVRKADGFDFADKGYQEKRLAAERLKKAFIISKGLVGMDVPGDNLEAKAKFLSDSFPPNVTDALHQAIFNLTGATLEKASFI